MKVSYQWLKDYCAFEFEPYELADRLSYVGLCVESYEPVGDDWMLDVEVTTNRPDCLGHAGIAREIAALSGKALRLPEPPALEEVEPAFDQECSVEVECPDLCPHYTARLIRGVEVGQSPQWLRQRLATCGLRPINNVVDVTNYVLLETGQPLHAFDLARLERGKIIVRRGGAGEMITAIDGTQCELDPEMCVIADASRPVAIAGVMGGLESEIGESTTDLLLESARFDPRSIRRTSRALGLSSDSSYRFERGVDPEGVNAASLRACQLILELAGGRLARGVGEVRADEPHSWEVTMRYSRLALVLGLEVERDEVRRIFDGLGLRTTGESDDAITVRPPSRRRDLAREIDLIEDVARLHGYDKILETTRIHVVSAPLLARQRCERAARRLLAGEGFDEVLTSSLVAPDPVQLAQPWHEGRPLALRNPVSADKTHLRLTTMGNLLAVKRFNAAHDVAEVDLFELGAIYLPRNTSQDELPQEKLVLGLLTDREEGLFVLKGVLANVMARLHVEGDLQEEPGACEPLDPDRALTLKLEGDLLGCVGVVSGDVAEQLDLATRPALMEVDFDRLMERAQFHPKVRPVPRYPSVERDVAVVVDDAVRWADLHRCVLESDPKHLESVAFLDVYRGRQIPAGKKSIAFSVTFRAADRTLTGEEADESHQHIVGALKDTLGAELR